jgi:hypothetical protein
VRKPDFTRRVAACLVVDEQKVCSKFQCQGDRLLFSWIDSRGQSVGKLGMLGSKDPHEWNGRYINGSPLVRPTQKFCYYGGRNDRFSEERAQQIKFSEMMKGDQEKYH